MALSRLDVSSKIKFYKKLVVGNDVKLYFLRAISDHSSSSNRFAGGSPSSTSSDGHYSKKRSNTSNGNNNNFKQSRASGFKNFNKSHPLDAKDSTSSSSSRYNNNNNNNNNLRFRQQQNPKKNVNLEKQVEKIKSNLRVLHNLSESSQSKSASSSRHPAAFSAASSAASTHREDVLNKPSVTGNDFWSSFVESNVAAATADGEMSDNGDNQVFDKRKRMAELAFINSLKNKNRKPTSPKQKEVEPPPQSNVVFTTYGQIRRDGPSSEPAKMEERNITAAGQRPVKMLKNANKEGKYNPIQSNVQNSMSNDKNNVKRTEAKRLNKPMLAENPEFNVNLFDDQYFGLSADRINNEPGSVVAGRRSPASTEDFENNFIEEQYFSSRGASSGQKSIFDLAGATQLTEQSNRNVSPSPNFRIRPSKAIVTDEVLSDVNFFDQSYFSEVGETGKQLPGDATAAGISDRDICAAIQTNFSYDQNDFDLENLFPETVDRNEEVEDAMEVATVTRGEAKRMQNRPADTENPKTAYDAVIKLRQENIDKTMNEKKQILTGEKKVIKKGPGKWDGHVDSKGFRILTSQVKDLDHMIDLDLVTILCDSILFENDQLVVLNKPYGLPSHGGPGIDKSIASLLDKMAERREKKRICKYHLVHRLDKETTGVMLLAKNEEVANLLLTRFENRKVIKTYWALTKGVPNPLEGVIDIPLGEGSINVHNGRGELEKKYRMELRPNYPNRMRLLKNSVDQTGVSEAITNYKVLESNNSCALVECKPETGVKHQIRCHLAFALNTPILGDHKYSHMSRLAPQKLPSDMLQKLGIRQAKVRHVPMHLHARSLVLPEFLPDGRNLFASARLPGHFVQNMKWLKLKIP